MKQENIDYKKIKKIRKNSIAEEMGIEVDMSIVAINGQQTFDILDYINTISDDFFELDIKDFDNSIVTIEIDKDEDEDMGLEFYYPLLDKGKNCMNKCVFCFIDQLPIGMRDTVYFKDDDYRMSLLAGNYISGTNLKKEDIDRIISLKASPLYISVHTTNEDLRVKMLNNKNAGRIKEIMKQLVDNNIFLHCQIVLCPGYNDNDELEKTISDLFNLGNNILSIAVVPVGITNYRENLAILQPVTKDISVNTIEIIEKWQEKFMDDKGETIVHCADEFYIMAEKSFPDVLTYGDLGQIEDGVGMASLFIQEFNNRLDELSAKNINKKALIITGESPYRFLNNLVDSFNKKMSSNIEIIAIKNNYFGNSVTVAGLVVGQDIVTQINGKNYDMIFVPDNMLKGREDIFLDGLSIDDIIKRTNLSVKAVTAKGDALVDELYNL